MNEKKGWRSIYAAATVALLSLAGGCAVNQQKEISTYRKWIDNNQPTPVAVAPDKVITLDAALRLANQNEETLSLQGEGYLQALIQKDITFSNFLPTLSFGPSWSYTSAGAHGTSQGLTVPLNGGINVFNGFRDYYSLKSEEMTIEQQKQLIFDAQQTVMLDVAQAYYAVLNAEQSVDVLSNSLKAQEENVRILHEQAKVGAARQLDVAQADAQASQTRVSLFQSQADVLNSRAMLAFLVNVPIKNNPIRDDFQPPSRVAELSEWQREGEQSRQDLIAADAALKSARYGVEVAFGQYYPTLTVNLSYLLYNPGDQPGTLWNGAIQANLPIFTGGLIHAEVRSAWSLYRQAALREIQLRRTIDETVEEGYNNLDLAQRELRELEIQVVAARDEFAYAQSLYKNGGGTYLNVLQAQSTLLSTQLQLTNEIFARKTAYFSLLRTAGTLSFGAMQSQTRPSEGDLRRLATQPVTRTSGNGGNGGSNYTPTTQEAEPSESPATQP